MSTKLVAFVCLHGSAKSLIAAEYLNLRARERGLSLHATMSGPEPDAEVPAHVVAGLLRRNIDARRLSPQRVSAEGLADAVHIVSFGCDLTGLAPPAAAIERWDDCPAVSDDFDVAWGFITARVENLMSRM
jgi:arsenate reductase (thioredoxin)